MGAVEHAKRVGKQLGLDDRQRSKPITGGIMKPAALAAVIVFTVVALAHLLRLVFQVEMVVGGTMVPMWASVVGVVVPLAIAVFLWREQRRE
jgi:uncharacterized membrane protein